LKKKDYKLKVIPLRTNKPQDNRQLQYLNNQLLGRFIESVSTYVNNEGRHIQIIYIYQIKMIHFLMTFDLNICRLALIPNNYKLSFYYETLKYLTPEVLDEITNKKMRIFDTTISNANLHGRILRYLDRGFAMIQEDENGEDKVLTIKEINDLFKYDLDEQIKDSDENMEYVVDRIRDQLENLQIDI